MSMVYLCRCVELPVVMIVAEFNLYSCECAAEFLVFYSCDCSES